MTTTIEQKSEVLIYAASKFSEYSFLNRDFFQVIPCYKGIAVDYPADGIQYSEILPVDETTTVQEAAEFIEENFIYYQQDLQHTCVYF